MTTLELLGDPGLDEIAYHIWERRGRPCSDGREEWNQAIEVHLDRKAARISEIAFDRWLERGKPCGTPLEDWSAAKVHVAWEAWARAKLRPYLSIEAVARAGHLGETDLGRNPRISAANTCLIALLDGAPEYSRWCHQALSTNCRPPEYYVKLKDSRFQKICTSTFRLFGGEFPDRPDESGDASNNRAFQDACVVAFTGHEHTRALQAALHLRHSLMDENEQQNRSWNERVHARITIAHGFVAAAQCLQNTWRDEITLPADILASFSDAERSLLLATKTRIGPAHPIPL